MIPRFEVHCTGELDGAGHFATDEHGVGIYRMVGERWVLETCAATQFVSLQDFKDELLDLSVGSLTFL